MRSDAGINGDAQCIEQITWMFFLKGYDTQEETWEYKAYKEKKEYNSIIPESLRRRVSAQQKFPGGYSAQIYSLFANNRVCLSQFCVYLTGFWSDSIKTSWRIDEMEKIKLKLHYGDT